MSERLLVETTCDLCGGLGTDTTSIVLDDEGRGVYAPCVGCSGSGGGLTPVEGEGILWCADHRTFGATRQFIAAHRSRHCRVANALLVLLPSLVEGSEE